MLILIPRMAVALIPIFPVSISSFFSSTSYALQQTKADSYNWLRDETREDEVECSALKLIEELCFIIFDLYLG